MRWSWEIAKLAGIKVYVHATFPLLLLWVGTSEYLDRHQWSDVLMALLFVLCLFAIVVLHELGHAVTARRFGIATRDITLLPIGGVARLERMPEDPRQELLVALAGPAVNLALAVFFFAFLEALDRSAQLARIHLGDTGFLASLMWVNVGLAAFNLLPAFPMDGGRVLRALLATRLPYPRATRIAAAIGQGMALLFCAVGLYSLFGFLGPFANPFLLLIGVFIWVGATREAHLVQLKSSLNGVSVSQVMMTRLVTLAPAEPLGIAAAHLQAGPQPDFPVVADGRLVGWLSRQNLIDGLAQHGAEAPVSAAMSTRFPTIAPSESLEAVLIRLHTQEGQVLPVTQNAELRGILTREKVAEHLLVEAALRNQPRRLTPPPVITPR